MLNSPKSEIDKRNLAVVALSLRSQGSQTGGTNSSPTPYSQSLATETDSIRLYSNLIRLDPVNGCWLWIGQFFVGGVPKAPGSKSARREIYAAAKGHRVARGMRATYTCDDHCCVNPAHTAVVTQHTLMLMANDRGRGNNQKSAKTRARISLALRKRSGLDLDKVRSIRERCEAGESTYVVARAYETSASNVQKIVTYQTWREMGSPLALLARQSGML